MDIVVTGLANDQGFASSFEHDVRPARPLLPHFLSICSFPSLMHDTVFISDFTQLTSSRYESSYHLLLLITG